MTVKELITELQKINDDSLEVELDTDLGSWYITEVSEWDDIIYISGKG